MKIKPIITSSSKRGESICNVCIYDDKYLLTKIMIYENYCADGWVGRISSEEYFTFLPMNSDDSAVKAFSLYSSPFTVLDIYNKSMKNRGIDPSSNEGRRYLLNLFKAIYALGVLMVDDVNITKSITAAIYSIFSFYLHGYEDDVAEYSNIYSLHSTANFPKDDSERIYNITLSETIASVCSNLTTVLYTQGYNVEKLADEVVEELREIYSITEKGGERLSSSSINGLTKDVDYYFYRDKDMDDNTAESIRNNLEQALVHREKCDDENCER